MYYTYKSEVVFYTIVTPFWISCETYDHKPEKRFFFIELMKRRMFFTAQQHYKLSEYNGVYKLVNITV